MSTTQNNSPNSPDDRQARIDALRRQAQELTPREQLLTHALEELQGGMEALRVAEEELRVQNEALEELRGILEQQVERYRDLFDHVPQAYLVTSPGGRIREANRAAEALLSGDGQALVGRPLGQFIAPADQKRFRDEILPSPTGEAASEWFVRLQTPRGTIPATLTVTAMRDAVGRPGGRRWLFRDATAAGQAEDERLGLLVQELADYAVFLMDEGGHVLTWNVGAQQIFGYAPDEILGRQAAIIFTPEDRAQEAESRERETARATGRAEDERWHLKQDGSRFWGSGIMTRLSGDGARARFVKIVRDTTERKQAEERMYADYEREQRIARTLQQSLLPQFAHDAFAGFAVAAFYEAALDEAGVGGDFYDIIPLREGRTAFAVGDVAGKGLDAAARTGEIRASLRAFLREDPDPASALARLNALVCDAEALDGVEDHLLIVAAVVVVEAATGQARFATAGLEPPLVAADSGGVEPVFVRGLTLGVSRDAAYEVVERRLAAGDLLVLATDGLTEARQGRRFLEYEGLQEIVRQALPHRSPRAIGEAVLAEVRRFTSGSPTRSALQDDACLLLARRLPPPRGDAGP